MLRPYGVRKEVLSERSWPAATSPSRSKEKKNFKKQPSLNQSAFWPEDAAGFALRGSRGKVFFSLQKELWPVEIDEGQMSQVINNIIMNADQDMPRGGIIQVQAENMSLEKDKVVHGLFLPKGDYISISIADQGVGIAAEHIPRVFDPYFTTKETGSGLGLPAALPNPMIRMSCEECCMK